MSVICTWKDCYSTFVSKSSLNRHVKIVHEKKRSYICSVENCGATFGYSFDLKRHVLGIHKNERNYKCSLCTQTFNISNSLRRHEQVIHGKVLKITDEVVCVEKPTFICADCGFESRRKDNLVKHIYSRHTSHEYFRCHDCGCKFTQKYYLRKHILTKHLGKDHAEVAQKSHIRCIQCQQSFQHVYQVLDHYVEVHDIDLNKQTLSFSSEQEFLVWKRTLEDATVTRFYLTRRSKNICTYSCHRSGSYTVKSADRKRAPCRRGSKKLNGVCPASITLRMNQNDTSCVATFIPTHVGHSSNNREELKFTFLHKEDRKRLREFLTAGIPKRQILDKQLKDSDTVLCDFMNANVTRRDLLSNKDLCNIESSFNMKCNETSTKSNQNDTKTVEEFVNQFRGSILFYKPQGESPPKKFSDCQLKDNDVILIFMCPSQEKMLKKHGRNVVCIDSTHGVDPYGLILHSLLVIDYDGEGFPAAFVFSNRNDKMLMKVFLRCIKEKTTENFTPLTLMSHMEETCNNAWIEEMGEPEVYLHCMWYVWQEWKNHLPKGNRKIKQDLYDLSVEASVDTFHEKLETFLTQSVDPKTNDFLKYFIKEYCNDDKWLSWSYAYRLHAGENINTHLESFNRTLEYLHGCQKTFKDLYSGLRLIVSYIRQKVNSLLGKAVCDKITPRLTALQQAHEQVLEKGVISIQKIDEGWLVPSFQVAKDGCEEMYIIRKIRDKCPATEDEDIHACYLICSECNECAHKYSCTCIENGIRSHMCKHIHAVILFENALSDQTEECVPSPASPLSNENFPSSAESEQQLTLPIFFENFSPSAQSVPKTASSFEVQLQASVLDDSQPVSSKLVLQEITHVLDQKVVNADQLRQNSLKRFTSLLNKLESEDHFDTIEEYLNHMESAFFGNS